VGKVYTTFVTKDVFDAPFDSVIGVMAVGGDVTSVRLDEDGLSVMRSAATPMVIELETTCPDELDPMNR
jgi:hypothetical protein